MQTLTKYRKALIDLVMYHMNDNQCKQATVLLRPMFEKPVRMERKYAGREDKPLILDQQYKGTMEVD